MAAAGALGVAVDVIAVISDTLPLNEAAFAAPPFQVVSVVQSILRRSPIGNSQERMARGLEA